MTMTRRMQVGIGAALLGLIALGFLTACSKSEQANLVSTPSTVERYEALRKTGIIRIGYAVGAPLLIVDPNTKEKSGIFYEVVNAAVQKLGLKAEWKEEVGYGEMIQGLNSGRYDLVGSGVWINSARGREALFTNPVYFDAVFAYARAGDTRFDRDLSHLNAKNYKISTMDGELGATIAKSDFPNAAVEQLPQNSDFSQIILNVVNMKSDVVFLALAPARQYEAANPNKIKIVQPNKPVRIFPVSLMLNKQDTALKNALDYALLEMQTNGEIEAILKKYEKVPGSFLRVAPPFQVNP